MMIMSNYLKNSIPFKTVYCHGIVRDEKGDKMSKSKGNVINPTDIINSYSADSLRFTFANNTIHDHDINISHKLVETGKTFCTKLWNMVRFITMNITDSHSIKDIKPTDIDKWIINKLNKVISICSSSLEKFNFAEYTSTLYTFTWDHFCNNFLEFAKPFIQSKNIQQVLLLITTNILILLHPIMPHITEELFELIKTRVNDYGSIKSILDLEWSTPINIIPYSDEMDTFYDSFCQVIKTIRAVKNDYQIKSSDIDITICTNNKELLEYIKTNDKVIYKLCKINNINYTDTIHHTDNTIVVGLPLLNIYFKINEHFNINYKIMTLETKLVGYQKKLDKVNSIYKTTVSNKKKEKYIAIIKELETTINVTNNDIEEQKKYIQSID